MCMCSLNLSAYILHISWLGNDCKNNSKKIMSCCFLFFFLFICHYQTLPKGQWPVFRISHWIAQVFAMSDFRVVSVKIDPIQAAYISINNIDLFMLSLSCVYAAYEHKVWNTSNTAAEFHALYCSSGSNMYRSKYILLSLWQWRRGKTDTVELICNTLHRCELHFH
jgi:hypothetical protein